MALNHAGTFPTTAHGVEPKWNTDVAELRRQTCSLALLRWAALSRVMEGERASEIYKGVSLGLWLNMSLHMQTASSPEVLQRTGTGEL